MEGIINNKNPDLYQKIVHNSIDTSSQLTNHALPPELKFTISEEDDDNSIINNNQINDFIIKEDEKIVTNKEIIKEEENINNSLFYSEEEGKEVQKMKLVFNQKKNIRNSIKKGVDEKTQKLKSEITENDLNYLINFDLIKKKLTRIGIGVYKTEWLGMQIAVKKLKTKKNKNNNNELLKLTNEINMLASLRHPHIILYMGVSFDNNDCYMITEYAQGDSLFKFIHDSKKKFNDLQKINIAYQIATAIQYIHYRDIIHKDLKTDNILLDENYKIKLGHFGLSSNIKNNNINNNINSLNNISNDSYAYMAPEILSRDSYNSYKKSADIFSYGMILWELITDEIPYANLKKKDEFIEEIVKKRKLITIPKEGNKILIELAKQCLQYKPENRPTIEKIVKYLVDVNKGLNESIDTVLDDFYNFVS